MFPTGEVGRARSALFFLPKANGKTYAADLVEGKKRCERHKIKVWRFSCCGLFDL